MSMLAIAGITSGAKIIGGEIAKSKAKKEGRKAEAEINAQTAEQSKKLANAYEGKAQSERDLGNIYKGQTSISPETQYARNSSEKATASAIDKATRGGGSTGEIMNTVSALTSKGQDRSESISAAEGERRRAAELGAGSQAAKAAQVGLAGEAAQIQLQDKAYDKTRQKQLDINDAVGQNYNFYSGALGDLSSAAMMDAGGEINPETGSFMIGSGLTRSYKKQAKKINTKYAKSPVGMGYSSDPTKISSIYKSPSATVKPPRF